ncbi:hypothetical protein [Metabacillus idriensis]|nr:hypothetical protein [Metabacillus idriensis]
MKELQSDSHGFFMEEARAIEQISSLLCENEKKNQAANGRLDSA